jgi:hypothetical protein
MTLTFLSLPFPGSYNISGNNISGNVGKIVGDLRILLVWGYRFIFSGM